MKRTSTTLPTLLLIWFGTGLWAVAQGTAFVYQGQLTEGGLPVHGIYDLRFGICDSATNGSVVAGPLTNSAIAVTNGLFTAALDFGPGVFAGEALWLEIAVRTNGGGAFTPLTPRQPLTPAPYALYAPNAGIAATANSAFAVAANGVANASLQADAVTTDKIADGTLALSDLSPALASNTFWRLRGNTGIVPGTHFLGTTDDQPLELKVNHQRALRLEPTTNSPNLVGGFNGNSVGAGSEGAVIAGGGASGVVNEIGTDSDYSTIAGGAHNSIASNSRNAAIGGGGGNDIGVDADYSTIGGGYGSSIASNTWNATIAGGIWNDIGVDGDLGTIGGGYRNHIASNSWGATISGGSGNDTDMNADYATIGGGAGNTISSNTHSVTISGGSVNKIGADTDYSAIGGGRQNVIQDNAEYAVISGGFDNRVSSLGGLVAAGRQNRIETNADFAVIGGGGANLVKTNAPYAFIGGGEDNQAADEFAAVGGGRHNRAHGSHSTVAGGGSNQATNRYATVPGGQLNLAGGQFSLAAGHRARSVHDGTFVWGDATEADFSSTRSNQFLIRANGGVGIGTNDPQTALHVAGTVTATGFAGGGGLLSLGTADNSPLEFTVAGERALRLEPAGSNAVNVVAGAAVNSVASGVVGATIGGGGTGAFYGQSSPNRVEAHFGTIAGGRGNTIKTDAYDTVIGGGLANVIGTNANFAVIGGGSGNTIESFAISATIPGGSANSVAGAYGFAAGRRAKAYHDGTFVWADSTDADFVSTSHDQFLIRASGGVGIGTVDPAQTLQIGERWTPDSQGMIRLESRSGTGNAHREWEIGVPETDEDLSGVGYSFVIDDVTQGTTPEFVIEHSSGRVGIGTVAPGRLLQVGDPNTPNAEGMIRLASRAGGTGTGYRVWDVGVPENDTSLAGKYFSFVIDDLQQGTGPEFIIRWNSGNVGIGTTNPLAKLHVAGDLRVQGDILADDEILELKVNNVRGFRLEDNGDSNDPGTASDEAPNVIGGAAINWVAPDVVGATISGGGGTVFTVVTGGGEETPRSNSIAASYAVIGGGRANYIKAGGTLGAIGGGEFNVIQTNVGHATIGGGKGNHIHAAADSAAIGGGYDNTIQTDAVAGTIGGGGMNMIQTNAAYATIGGGWENEILTDAHDATIGGGERNTVDRDSHHGTIGGGRSNRIDDRSAYATMGGGYANRIWPDADYATIGGGALNVSKGNYGVVPGGNNNEANADHSFAAGRRAKANHTGAFVWGDSTDADIASSTTDQITLRASGGTRIYSSSSLLTGVRLDSGSGSWNMISDRHAKENLQSIDSREVLDQVMTLPLSTWNYKTQDKAIRHLGPMAQDFHAAFGVGEDDTSISSVDADGVALAAIQGLNQKLEEQLQARDAEIRELKAANQSLEERLRALEGRFRTVTARHR